ncbi:DUF5666 domain-containing protein [Thiothrix nivea]|uniref:DUF5666 domain-containing protein n=1 Tax=Thiothrix nivea (strain ATCC 35100 / DSM 5205 / JP2) TaxID=870187 RepID=A0A656HM03_THINJ|nr:DUF5666 domain-containing protein [Thiothrix nivea]EIJ36045.1 hypothetical protein Thini_3539 [Thiothrix nivea DSM 5205]
MKIRTLFVTLFLGMLLSACGAGVLQLANGGIGGTGISAGSITAFGSIFVNGVEYEVDQATFTRNGLMAGGQGEFNVGEYVTVKGTVNPDGITGTATEVAFSSELNGTVTGASTDGVNIQVLGQAVRTNALTVLSGFKQLIDLLAGNVVEVSGVRDAQGVLVASSIRLEQGNYLPGDTQALKGPILQVDTQRSTVLIGGLTVDYSGAALLGFTASEPEVGQYVRVRSVQAVAGAQLVASELELQSAGWQFEEGEKLELEGVVTRFASVNDFAVNGVPVVVNAGTQFEHGSASQLALNALVEVDGQINASGAIVAEEVSIKESISSGIDELSGAITAINPSAQEFTLAGVTIIVDSSTIWEDESAYGVRQMNFTYLQMGDFVEVDVKPLDNGKLLALRIKREDGEDEDD